MKNILKTIFLLTGISMGYSQTSNENIIKITYDKISWSENEGTFETYLYADNTKSQFLHPLTSTFFTTSEGYEITLNRNYYINNYDFQTNSIEDNRILGDETALYTQWENDLVWEITDEEKEIGGYKVIKATTDSFEIDKNSEWYSRKAIAWFTTDIPIPSGPERYYGLPGVILELSYERGRDRYKFKKLEYIPKSNYQFIELDKSNKVEEKEDVIWGTHKNPKKIKEIQRNNRKRK